MKKFAVLIAMLASISTLTAKNDTSIVRDNDSILYLTDPSMPEFVLLCNDWTVKIFGPDDCDGFSWTINGLVRPEWSNVNPLVINGSSTFGYSINGLYEGCDFSKSVHIYFGDPNELPNPFQQVIWKRSNEIAIVEAVGADSANWYPYHWLPTNETTWSIEVLSPGTFTCEIVTVCGSVERTFIVRDNVEIYRASVDLATNLNKVTWQTTPEQAEYISQVKVYRDGFFVGTVPYENGYFLDAIGSDNAARNYQIVGVTPEGEDCPIASYQKGTIHTTYYLDVNDNLNMTWNIPYVEQGAQGTLTYFQVCKYDPITEQLTVVDQVNSLITDYTCGVNQFAGGYPVIAAVFSDAKNREFEDMSFSNMYTDISIQPQEITITLAPGWTWFSYPYVEAMNIASALGDFVPMEGDMIKSQFGNSSYRNGQWKGSVHQFIPGLGYKYFSTRTEPATLVFDLSSSR